jgi:predicted Zn-dependent protease
MKIPMLASLLASAALGAINPSMGMGAVMATMGGFSQDSINFTRSKEKEADRIGIQMLGKAGFNPEGMATFFRKMQENARYYYTANIPAILRTHPMDEDRIAEAENRIAKMPRNKHEDTLDYRLFKELIRTSVSRDTQQLMRYYLQECKKTNPALSCQFGHALTLVHSNRYQDALNILMPLTLLQPDNLYFQITTAEVELSLHHNDNALQRLQILQSAYPENYAVLLAYAQGLAKTDQTGKAINVLLKANRLYKNDPTLCKALARTQAQAKQQSYAYFTQAQCLLIEGQKRAAISQLKVAQNLAKGDSYLLARISAKMEEIRFLSE